MSTAPLLQAGTLPDIDVVTATRAAVRARPARLRCIASLCKPPASHPEVVALLRNRGLVGCLDAHLAHEVQVCLNAQVRQRQLLGGWAGRERARGSGALAGLLLHGGSWQPGCRAALQHVVVQLLHAHCSNRYLVHSCGKCNNPSCDQMQAGTKRRRAARSSSSNTMRSDSRTGKCIRDSRMGWCGPWMPADTWCQQQRRRPPLQPAAGDGGSSGGLGLRPFPPAQTSHTAPLSQYWPQAAAPATHGWRPGPSLPPGSGRRWRLPS